MSIRKRTWATGKGEEKEAWVADYFDQQKKRHIKTLRKKDADAWLAETKGEVKKGIHTPSRDSITVAEAGEAWIIQAEADALERSTVMNYRSHLDLHIKPFLGARKLCELTPADVRAFRNGLRLAERSPAMTKKAIGSLGSILRNALADNKVARNVVHEEAQHGRRRNLNCATRGSSKWGSTCRPRMSCGHC